MFTYFRAARFWDAIDEHTHFRTTVDTIPSDYTSELDGGANQTCSTTIFTNTQQQVTRNKHLEDSSVSIEELIDLVTQTGSHFPSDHTQTDENEDTSTDKSTLKKVSDRRVD